MYLLFTQVIDDSPIGVRYREPLAISRPNVDIDRAEVVILLMSRGSRTRHFHIQLHRVHTQDHVTYMGEHVACGYDAGKGRQLQQLLELSFPLALVRKVYVGAET